MVRYYALCPFVTVFILMNLLKPLEAPHIVGSALNDLTRSKIIPVTSGSKMFVMVFCVRDKSLQISSFCNTALSLLNTLKSLWQ